MKKLLSLLGALTLTATSTVSVVACQDKLKDVDLADRYQFTPASVAEDGHDGINNYLQDLKKQEEFVKTGTLYYVSRAGAAIGVQTFTAAITEAINFPQRKIIIYLSDKMDPNGPLGKNTLDFDSITKNFKNIKIEYLKNSNEELKPFIIESAIKELKAMESEIEKLNLFVDDYAMSSKVTKSALTNLGSVMNYIEFMTLMTDGTAHNTFSVDLFDNLKSLSKDRFTEVEKEILEMFKGNYNNKSNIKNFINTFFPLITTKNEYGVRYFNSWSISDVQFYDNSSYWTPRNTYSSVGAGLQSAITSWEENSDINALDIFKDTFKLTPELLPNPKTKFNFVYSGNKMGEGITVNKSAEAIKSIKDKLDLKHPNEEFTIWFKPHPRESQSNIDAMIKAAKKLGVTQIEVIKQEIPLEIYLYAGAFKEVDDKKFGIIATASSTAVMALYDSKIPDIIEAYLFDSEAQLNSYKEQYGSSSKLYNSFENAWII